MDTLKIFSVVGLLLYFIILLTIVVKEKKSNTVVDFFFAGRQLPFWVLSITFIASWWGAGSALSTADLAYVDGIGAYWYYGVPVLIATFILIFLAKTIRSSSELTQGGMMTKRYNKLVGKTLSFLIMISMTLAAASQMVGVGDFIGSYLGFEYSTAVFLGSGIVLIYSIFGGFRGVVLTDIVQFILLLVSAVAVFAVAYYNAGGWAGIEAKAISESNISFMSFFDGMSTYGAYVLTFGFGWSIQSNVWQRVTASRNEKDAFRMAVTSFIAYIPLYLIVILTGMAGYVLFDEMPKGGVVSGIVNQYMHPVLGAVTFVGISAAIMSTMDSLINTAAMSLTLDMGFFKDNKDKQLAFSRVSTLIVTIIALFIALRIPSILTISWLASDIIVTGVFVPLIAGFFWKRGTWQGAMVSMIMGGTFCFYNLFISLGADLPKFWEIESPEQVALGAFISAIFYFVVSLMTKNETEGKLA